MGMRLALAALLVVASMGCGTIYAHSHREEIDGSRAAIRELTALLEHEPARLLARLTKDNGYEAYDILPLGFDHTSESGTFRLDDRIRLSLTVIRHGRTAISYRAEPDLGHVGGSQREAYRGLWEDAGWKVIGDFDRFMPRYYGYDVTTAPVELPPGERRPELDELMSPYAGVALELSGSPSAPRGDFEVAAVGLDDGGFWYLLHALNPVTRALAIRHLRCHPRGPAPAIDAWIAHLLATSPPVETSFGDIEGQMPLAHATRCCGSRNRRDSGSACGGAPAR
jgi:hypothetical protein